MSLLVPDLDYTDRPKMGRPRTVFVREDYFDEIDEERAYWLGFLYADGAALHHASNGRPSWVLACNLAVKDAGHLERLQAVLGGSLKIHGRALGGFGGTDVARFAVYSKRVCLAVGKYGILPRKSHDPVLPPILGFANNRAFLRGLFDGDGCLHINRRGLLQLAFCGHPVLVEWVTSSIEGVLGITSSTQYRGNTAYAQWTGHTKAMLLACYLYGAGAELEPVLLRKQAIAERFV